MYIILRDYMKSYLKIILGAVLVGSLFAYLFYKDISSEVVAITNKEYEITLFQAGVFKSYDNAQNYQNNFDASIIYEDDGYYCVIIGIAYHEENKVKLESFFTSKGINYYEKEIRVNEEFTSSLTNYELVVIESTEDKVINNVNNSMLQLFLSYLTKKITY